MTNPAKLTIIVSLALVVVLGAVTLTRSPPRVVGGSARGEDVLGSTVGNAAACQTGEVLPRGVSAIRLWLEGEFGPPVLVRAYSGSRLLTEGRRGAGWTASGVTVPVTPLQRTVSGVKLCFAAQPNSERLQLYGVSTGAREAAVGAGGQPLTGRMTVEYLAPGGGSWWSRALSVARHMGIGRAVSGSWLALLVAALMAAVLVLATRLAWRELP
jgi:hypothetical protein